jgi:NAD(P)H-hydrate repair Nnr-like enzyme with NAD(P)H-hydrate dehydratase domain
VTAVKGLGPFLGGFAVAAVLAALTAWASGAGQLTVAERVNAPGVILQEDEEG